MTKPLSGELTFLSDTGRSQLVGVVRDAAVIGTGKASIGQPLINRLAPPATDARRLNRTTNSVNRLPKSAHGFSKNQQSVEFITQLKVESMRPDNQRMVDSDEIRKEFSRRLNEALDDRGMPMRGRATAIHGVLVSAGVGASTTAIGKWLSGQGLPERSRIIALAAWLGVREEWLEYGVGPKRQSDLPDGTYPGKTGTSSPTRQPHSLYIPQYETGGMGGNGGLVLKDQPGIIQNWSVTHEWVRANIPYCTSPANLCLVTGFGDSMPDMYSPGDPLVVDQGIKICDHDGVYFFRVDNEGYIKHLQRIPGEGILVVSQNPIYRDWSIKPGMDFEVFGKVLKAWKGKNY